MREPIVYPVGGTTFSWIKQGGRPDRGGWLHKFMFRWQSQWFDRNLALQSRLQDARPCRNDPVFILGLWRAGTTFLHDLLSSCPGMISPSTWQCMNASSFRLRTSPRCRTSVKRPMDGMTIDALSPQEDEFALLALGIPSVYRGFFDPRRLPELALWLDPDFWMDKAPIGWMEVWLRFLNGIVENSSSRLILKSPGHTFRINAVTETFPDATYIWLVRDPTETFLSNRKMWLSMFKRYSLWNWDFSLLDEFLGQALDFAAECLARATRLFSKDRLVVVPFERITSVTLDSLEAINRRLYLGDWNEIKHPLIRVVTGNAGYKPEFYKNTKLPYAASKAAKILNSVQKEALNSHGL
jgi:omega-hydroxy-beta-dihydromenaquinone-9 sulfotransferase